MNQYLWLIVPILIPIVYFFIVWLYVILFLIFAKYQKGLHHEHRTVMYARQIFAHVLVRTLRIEYKVKGIESLPDTHFLVYSNHQSLIDPIVLIYELNHKNLSGISKKQVFDIPIIKPWLEYTRVLALDREDNRKGAETMIQAIKQAKEGQPMFIFPEGTRSKDGHLLPFKQGAFKLATKSKLPIYLAYFRNFHKHKWLHLRDENLSLEFVGPITYEVYKDMSTKELSEYIKHKFETECCGE